MSEQKLQMENVMRKIKLEKIVLSCGATGLELEKSRKLLEMLSGAKVKTVRAGPQRRIPSFGVKPNMPLGVVVTLRGKKAVELLKRLLGAVDNKVKKKQIAENAFSFGIREYIEIPGTEYDRDIGIRGLNVTISFIRAGVRVKRRKLKPSKLPERQLISAGEIIDFMKENFGMEVFGK